MDKETVLRLYRKMLVLRHMDEMCLELKLKDLIMDGFHPYQGQEAVAVGVCAALQPDDVVISNHRPQGHAVAKGIPPRDIFAEFLGRRGGCSQGIGGPMQFIDVAHAFYCGSIVGSGITIAAGVAAALKREGRGRVAVCFFGDGASNTGSFHEGLNLAAIWHLPVVYVLENNQYAEAMPVGEFVPVQPLSLRADAYGMSAVTVDGMDVEAVFAAADNAVRIVRSGATPVLIEATTYRFKGHYGGDPEHTYRSREEVEAWRQKDPLPRVREQLRQEGCGEAVLADLEQAVMRQLEADQAWALQQPFPTVEQATDHVMLPIELEC
jgi:TPP-dependent pyruvate/acetoin dehydrogenase alpha subunit